MVGVIISVGSGVSAATYAEVLTEALLGRRGPQARPSDFTAIAVLEKTIAPPETAMFSPVGESAM